MQIDAFLQKLDSRRFWAFSNEFRPYFSSGLAFISSHVTGSPVISKGGRISSVGDSVLTLHKRGDAFGAIFQN